MMPEEWTPEDRRHMDRFVARATVKHLIENFYKNRVQRERVFAAIRDGRRGATVTINYATDLRALQRALQQELQDLSRARGNRELPYRVRVRRGLIERYMRRFLLREPRMREFLSGPLEVKIVEPET